MTQKVGAKAASVEMVATIRDKDGNVKGTVKLSGSTALSEAELREKLGLKGINENGSNTRSGGS